jgi:hypothetical protein
LQDDEQDLCQIHIPEFPPSVVRVMVHYCYHQRLEIPNRPPSTEHLFFVLQVYLIAIRYKIHTMDELAFELLSDTCDAHICGETFIEAVSQIHADRYEYARKEVDEILAQITRRLMVKFVVTIVGVQAPTARHSVA